MRPFSLSLPFLRQARHHGDVAITLIPLLLDLLVAGQINVFRQWRPFAHPRVHLLRLAIAGQRLQPVLVGSSDDITSLSAGDPMFRR